MLINEMMIFYHVVNLKNFTQAAIKLKVSKSHVSKHISKLEKDLMVKLLNRSTRNISLTQEGKVFYNHCQKLFEQAQIGYESIANIRKQPIGTLKISVPPAFALHVLNNPLMEFSRDNPEVKLNIILDSNIEDIIEQGYDLALRSAILPDSNLMAQKLYTFRNILCATPEYLNSNESINKIEQLSSHKFAIYSNGKLLHELKFKNGNNESSVFIDPYMQSNSADFILQMVKCNSCIALLPEFMVKSQILSNELVECLPKYKMADSTLYAIYPDKKFIPLRVKVFVEQLRTYLSLMY